MSDDLDPRWRRAIRAHADQAEPTPDVWAAIAERADEAAPDPATEVGMPTGRARWLSAAAVVVVLALGGLALALATTDDDGVVTADSTTSTEPDSTTTTEPTPPGGTPVVRARGQVVEDASGTHLCGAHVQASMPPVDPPTCGEIPLIGWDWDAVTGETTEGATTWVADAEVIGTYDDVAITVTGEVPEGATVPAGDPTWDDPHDRMEPPCPSPPGGWTVTDPDRLADEDLMAFRAAAEGDPQLAGIWFDDTAGDEHGVYTVAFTAEVERHRAELAALWGGPICVISRDAALARLEGAGAALTRDIEIGIIVDGFTLRLTEIGPDPEGSRLEVGLVYAPGSTEEFLSSQLGVPVRVTSLLERIG